MKRLHKPLPTHNKVHFDPHEIIAIIGPWGSGKSTIAAIEVAIWQRKYRCDALVVRDTYPALRDSCAKKWCELFQGLGEMMWGPPPTWHWRNELKGLEVLFRSAERPEDIQKFGSVEVGVAWLEEATPGLLPGGALNLGLSPEVLSGVIGRIRKWGVEGNHRKLFLTALPPPTTRHWFYKLFYDKKPFLETISQEAIDALARQVVLYKLLPDENLANLPPDYYTTQAAFLTSEDQIARFLKGEVGSSYSGVAIYADQWNDLLHQNPKLEPIPGPMILGVDGGLDAAAIWMQAQPSGRMYVLAELCTHGLGLEDFGLACLQHGNQLFGERMYDVWADPAIFSRSQNNARDGASYLRSVGLTAKPAPQDPYLRISSVRTWLKRLGSGGALIQVHPRCEMLIEGFRGGYHWKTAGGVPIVDDKGRNKPDKNEFSHPHDAFQYPLSALLHRFDGQHEKLPPLKQIDRLGMMRPLPGSQPRPTRRGFTGNKPW